MEKLALASVKISPKQLKIVGLRKKLLLTAHMKSFAGFRLPPKYVTLNDLWERFKVIDSLKAAKNDEIQLSNDSDTIRLAWCIISIRATYSRARELTYLLNYLHRITSVLCDCPVIVSRLFSEWFVLRSTAFNRPYDDKRTVSIVLYCGIARFALLLHAAF